VLRVFIKLFPFRDWENSGGGFLYCKTKNVNNLHINSQPSVLNTYILT